MNKVLERPKLEELNDEEQREELEFYSVFCSEFLIFWRFHLFLSVASISILYLFDLYLKLKLERLIYIIIFMTIFLTSYIINSFRTNHIFKEITFRVTNVDRF